jgi:hypothetical protein
VFAATTALPLSPSFDHIPSALPGVVFAGGFQKRRCSKKVETKKNEISKWKTTAEEK